MAVNSQAIWAFLFEEAKKWLARTSIMVTVALMAYLTTPLKDRLIGIWQGPERLAEISAKLDQLGEDVRRANGEDSVIFEPVGFSYVSEPVYQGDQITLFLIVQRTSTGAACTLLNRTALFTDESNIASAGPAQRPSRQIGTAATPLRLTLDVPPQVMPGRVSVYLSLEFDCAGETVFDRTRPVAFALLEPNQRPGNDL